MYARCTYQTSVKLGHQSYNQQKCIISAEYQHKPQESDGCLLSLAFGMDTKVSNGDKLSDRKCVGCTYQTRNRGNLFGTNLRINKLIILAVHKKKPQVFDGCLLSCANDVYSALLPVLEINSGNQNVFKVDISNREQRKNFWHKSTY